MSFFDTFRDLLVEDREMRENTRGPSQDRSAVDGGTAGAFLGEFGGYMVPGTGVVDAGGRYPALTDPEQAYYPSLPDNLRQGNYGMAAGQLGGLVGDGLYAGGAAMAATGAGAIPGGLLMGAGAIAKAPRAAQKATNARKPRRSGQTGDERTMSFDPKTGEPVPLGRSKEDTARLKNEEKRIRSEMQAREAAGEAPFPELADRYPHPGEPFYKLKTPKDPGAGAYLAKGDSAESRVFQKRRAEIIQDMRDAGYEPYFPPGERRNADVGFYPDAETTQALARPAKDVTAQQWVDAFQTPEARGRLQQAIAKSDEVGGGDRWYHMGQLQDEYLRALGPEEGARRFQEDFARQMAATTGGADPTANFLTSMYANFLRGTGSPFPQASHEAPFPIGGRYVGGNLEMADQVMRGERTLNAADQPKRHNFMRNFLGDESVSTIDEQMMGGMYPGRNLAAPPGDSYFAIEGLLNEAGGSRAQDRAWHGFKVLKDAEKGKPPQLGKPMVEHVNESIERTSRLTGVPKEEVVRRWINRTMPAYGTAGLLAAGGLTLGGIQAQQPQGLLPDS